MSSESLVTRERLAHWGFVRLPDVWLPCPAEGRRKYFERWYHAEWNYSAVVGWHGKDPLSMNEEDFLAAVQAYLLDDSDFSENRGEEEVPGRI